MSTATDREDDGLELAVLGAIDARPPVHMIDLADAVGEHPVAVERVCSRLHEDGYIRPDTHGLYTPTEAGRQRLTDRTR
ncbi:hypothetical protein JCM30237_23500 [Halolamina litorea]|uniref:MarR family protein n=1 Tax=Halolamina litorea TaxID=1515593 RepID=A0ABD6BV86_9EURY|nr:helix-turn-helix domain-containing protein [Halolamina litorea]